MSRRSCSVARLFLIAALSLISTLTWQSVAAAASLDRGFGVGGLRTYAPDGAVSDILAGRDGHIWLLANGNGGAEVVALSQRGDLDPRFGRGGVAHIDDAVSAHELVALPRGGFMLVGIREPPLDPSVWRLSRTGRVVSRTDLPTDGLQSVALAAARAPGHRVVIVIGTRTIAGRAGTVIARVTDSNRLDPGFGHGGLVRASGARETPLAFRGLAIRPNGKLVLAGMCGPCSGPSVLITQFGRRGRIDTTFGGDGRTRLFSQRLNRVGIGVSGLAIARNGDLFVGLARGSVVRVTRAHIERGFGADGVTRTGLGVGLSAPLILPTGALVNAGAARLSSPRPTLVAHTPSGIIDRGFSRNGRFTLPLPVGFRSARAQSMALDAQGRLLVAGQSARAPRLGCCDTRVTVWRMRLR